MDMKNKRLEKILAEGPQVMGILNLTPDSFYADSRKQTDDAIRQRVRQILREGGTIIDAGAMSTRPGGDMVSEEEELRRMARGLDIVRQEAPDALLSIDTFRPAVARMAVEQYGADIINDVSEGGMTGLEGVSLEGKVKGIFEEVARLGVAYILMSVQSNVEDMLRNWHQEVQQLHNLGVEDIIIDPGYGFGKTIDENYAILRQQERLVKEMALPLLAGVSRKRMIWQLLNSSADEALAGTITVDTLALERGASILRVHDVRPAVESCVIYKKII